jgi:hypothetical protein
MKNVAFLSQLGLCSAPACRQRVHGGMSEQQGETQHLLAVRYHLPRPLATCQLHNQSAIQEMRVASLARVSAAAFALVAAVADIELYSPPVGEGGAILGLVDGLTGPTTAYKGLILISEDGTNWWDKVRRAAAQRGSHARY